MKRTPTACACIAATAIASLAFAPTASAQTDPGAAPAAEGEFSVQRFEPAPGPRNFLSVAGGRTDGEWTWGAGLLFDYQRAPFVLQSCVSESECASPNARQPDDVAVVQDMMTWNVMGSITPIPRLQIGLRVPVALASGDGLDLTTGRGVAGGLNGVGLGDIMLEGKVRIVGEPSDVFVLAAAADVAAPMGSVTASGSYIGNDTPITVGGRAILDVQIDGFSAALNLRGIYRPEASFGDTSIGSEFRYGAAVGYQPHEMLRIIAETFGASRFSSVNGTNPLEIDGGLQLLLWEQKIMLTAAGGTGVVKGIGVPLARAIVGMSFFYQQSDDADGDGIADDDDECPTKAEDSDGIADEDGCPEDDFDHDTFLDDVDKCPLQAEVENGYKDDDGCPDTVEDADKDGFTDDVDKCPQQAGKMQREQFKGCPDSDQDGVADLTDQCPGGIEDTDGFADTDGCPDPDNDGDGVLDIADECADGKEIVNGIDDTDGCPDFFPDEDGDGIPDDTDACVDKAEILNDKDDTDGCPEPEPALVDVTPEAITLKVPVPFTGAAVTDPKAMAAFRALASGLKNWPQIVRVQVVVTTTKAEAAEGDPRAKGIISQLVIGGVAEERLVPMSMVGDVSSVTFAILQATARQP